MVPAERQLRVIQITCVAFTAACIYFTFSILRSAERPFSVLQGVVVLCALWSASSGFMVQRLFNRIGSRKLSPDGRSTPLGRWKVGHLMRLATATSVGLWALLLHIFGSPSWLAGAVYALALVLLLIWSPGTASESVNPTS